MKKVCLMIAVIAFYFISCSVTKETFKVDKDYYKDPYVKKYSGNPNFISPEQAAAYIGEFKYHKNRIIGKKHLTNAWSYFDRNILDSLANDQQTDSIIFYLAAFTKDKSIPHSLKGDPFVILQAVPKGKEVTFNKGGYEAPSTNSKNSVFMAPSPICPPPNYGCKVAGQQ